MLQKLLVFVFALGALNATANTITAADPLDDFIASEIEKLELENELFGVLANNDEIVSIASISVDDLNENVELDFNTAAYLPVGFDAREGMNDIDWDTIELYEIEEEVDLNSNSQDQMPKIIIPSKKVDCDTFTVVNINN